MHRFAPVATLIAALLGGCIGAPAGEPPAAIGAPDVDLRCVDAGPQVIDVQAVNNGGQGDQNFTLSEGCALAITFRLDRMVGNFRLTVEGPAGLVVDIERHGVQEGGAIVATGPRSAEIINAGPAPAGDYAYAWVADAVAEFSIEVEAQRA